MAPTNPADKKKAEAALELNKMLLEARTKRKNEALAERVFSKKQTAIGNGLGAGRGSVRSLGARAASGPSVLLGKHKIGKVSKVSLEQARRDQALQVCYR
jgi:hypothetical protein